MPERDDFSWRFAEQRPIHVHELMYPLLQGYDSVALDCDIELGGTDQLFNLLVGRDLMPRYGLRPQMVMTTPLLEGTDARVVDGKVTGKKMAKSAENYVGITEPPFELQMLMLVDDLVIWHWLDAACQRVKRRRSVELMHRCGRLERERPVGAERRRVRGRESVLAHPHNPACRVVLLALLGLVPLDAHRGRCRSDPFHESPKHHPDRQRRCDNGPVSGLAEDLGPEHQGGAGNQPDRGSGSGGQQGSSSDQDAD
jgi:tRNA synthetases class I (W and Y)